MVLKNVNIEWSQRGEIEEKAPQAYLNGESIKLDQYCPFGEGK